MQGIKINLLFFLIFLIPIVTFSQIPENTDTVLIKQLLIKNSDKFEQILYNPENYRLQILYTQIDRSSEDVVFKHHSFRYKPHEYFYPASIIKLPLSLFCLEKINKLKSEGVTFDTHLAIDSSHSCQTSVKFDFSAPDSFPTIGNYIKKALVVSDNDAYNRLYEFMGQSYINNRLFSLGYSDARIVHRFSNCDSSDNKFTNGFVFYNNLGKIIWYQAPVQNTSSFSVPFPNMMAGEKTMAGKDIIPEPKDFSRKNCMPLNYIHDMLMKIFFPKNYSPWEQFNIAEDDMDYLKTQLSSLPKESGIIEYTDQKKYWDTYTKYLYYGNDPKAIMNPNLKIYNKVGLSYGFVTDCAFFSDTLHHVDFFLSAVIYANSDGIMGDDKYDYTTIAMPFMKELGRTIYEYELSLKK